MRITDLNVTMWPQLRAEVAAAPPGAPQRAPVTVLNAFDSNPCDGWLDDYDLPYDQFELLEEARAAAKPAASEVIQAAAPPPPEASAPAAAPAGATVAAPPVHVDVTPDAPPAAAPQFDALA
jgi:hypothetical protein